MTDKVDNSWWILRNLKRGSVVAVNRWQDEIKEMAVDWNKTKALYDPNDVNENMGIYEAQNVVMIPVERLATIKGILAERSKPSDDWGDKWHEGYSDAYREMLDLIKDL